jgi:hypothetical protein
MEIACDRNYITCSLQQCTATITAKPLDQKGMVMNQRDSLSFKIASTQGYVRPIECTTAMWPYQPLYVSIVGSVNYWIMTWADQLNRSDEPSGRHKSKEWVKKVVCIIE